jgi:hypothetical protein
MAEFWIGGGGSRTGKGGFETGTGTFILSPSQLLLLVVCKLLFGQQFKWYIPETSVSATLFICFDATIPKFQNVVVQSVCGYTPLCWALAAFSVSWTFTQSVGLLGRGISPLPAHRTARTQNKRTQTSMPQVAFEPTIPLFERAKTVHALEFAATVIGCCTVDTIHLLANMNIPKLVVGSTLIITQRAKKVTCILYQVRYTPMNNSINYPLEFFCCFNGATLCKVIHCHRILKSLNRNKDLVPH